MNDNKSGCEENSCKEDLMRGLLELFARADAAAEAATDDSAEK